MNKRNDKALEMFKRLAAYKKKNKDALSLLVALNVLFENLDAQILLIDGLRISQKATTTTGSTNQKKEYKILSIQLASEIISGLKGLAQATGNKTLAADINYSATELKPMGDAELKVILEVVYNNVLKYATEMATYGITTQKIADLRSAIDDFGGSIGIPKEGIRSKKTITEQLDDEVAEAMEIVSQIDLVMGTIRYSNTVLFQEYEKNRQIETYTRSLLARVQVTDAGTGAGIGNAKVIFTLDKEEIINKPTASGGGLNIKSIDEGKYTVTVSKLGYISQTLTFIVLAGQSDLLEVKMQKES
jgi:hypothetical protein